jgi:hypothetical protein
LEQVSSQINREMKPVPWIFVHETCSSKSEYIFDIDLWPLWEILDHRYFK